MFYLQHLSPYILFRLKPHFWHIQIVATWLDFGVRCHKREINISTNQSEFKRKPSAAVPVGASGLRGATSQVSPAALSARSSADKRSTKIPWHVPFCPLLFFFFFLGITDLDMRGSQLQWRSCACRVHVWVFVCLKNLWALLFSGIHKLRVEIISNQCAFAAG